MSSIHEAMGADLSGYKSASRLPALPLVLNGDRPKPNTGIRCPLPPFNSDPDTLRQFENSAYQMPQIRVIPLPQTTVAPPTRTPVSTSVAASSSGGTTPTNSLAPKNVTLSTGIIAAQTSFQSSVSTAKSYQLISVSASDVCEVRLYGSALVQAFDNARVEDSPVPPEITNNIISCVIFDTDPLSWPYQNRIAVNQDTPQTTTLYVSVFNSTDSDIANIAVSITYVPLEV